MRAVSPAEYDAPTTFYFDENGELVVPQHTLPEVYPNVRRLEGEGFVAEVTTVRGNTLFVNSNGLDWHGHDNFQWRSRLVSIKGYDRSEPFVYLGPDDTWGLHPKAAEQSSYIVRPADRIVMKDSRSWGRHMTVVPASDGLPGPSEPRGRSWYLPHAVITDSDELVVWGCDGGRAVHNADLVLANRLVRSRDDLRQISRQLGDASLRGMLNISTELTTYLTHIAENTGVDYTPAEDPMFRYKEFDA